MTSVPEWLMVVSLEVDTSIEPAWDRWYDELHLPEIVACPGFVRGTRYKAQPHPADGPALRRELSVYELTGPEAVATPEFAAARGLAEFAPKVNFRTRVFRRRLTVEEPAGE